MPAKAFHLDVRDDRTATVTFDLPDSRVNLFNQAVLTELRQLIGEVSHREEIGCLVLLSGKPGNFIAGADVDGIAGVTDPQEAERAVRAGHQVFSAWERLPFPTVAAISGTCVGGGTELALSSTFIVASDRDDVRIGLPEVRLGILPGWGGCTRLPERVGLTAALDLILTGRLIAPRKALRIGLLDALFPAASFDSLVREFALARLDTSRRGGRNRGLGKRLLEGNPVGRGTIFVQARKRTLEATHGHYPAPLRALEVVKVGVDRGREAGFEAEVRAEVELVTSPICKNLVHVFRLMESARRNDGAAPIRETQRAAVVGAGVMGGGIAQVLASRADVPVRLKDIDLESLASGMGHAAELFRKQVERRRLTRPEAKRRLGLIRPTLDYRGFERADVVVEAIVENLEVKRQVFAELSAVVRDETVLASNTSSLSIDQIGRDTVEPGRVIGMHFFNPVHKMPLIEVVVGPRTSEAATGSIVALARRLGKTPVIVKDGPGFLVNRLLAFYTSEAMWMLDEGYRIEDLDGAMVSWGMPMGPLELTDEVGIDVATKVGHILQEAFPDRLGFPTWVDDIAAPDRLGAKSGRGIYLYKKGRRTAPNEDLYERIGTAERRSDLDPAASAERVVLPMVNEAARCLEEGVVDSPRQLDLAMIMGTGFPPFRGGLCRWADSQGLGRLVDEMGRLSESVALRHRPNQALVRFAEVGGFYRA